MKNRILFLDDDKKRHDAFAQVSIGYVVDHVWTAPEAIEKLKDLNNEYGLVALDHDLGGMQFVDSQHPDGTGYTVAAWIEANEAEYQLDKRIEQIIIHSYNPAGAAAMQKALDNTKIPTERYPFGSWWPTPRA